MSFLKAAVAAGSVSIVMVTACSSSSGGGGGSGSGCSGLATCCSSLPAADQSNCTTVAKLNVQAACDSTIVGLHVSNDCTGVSAGTGGDGGGGSGTGTGSAQSCAQLKSCCTVGMFPEAQLTANCPTVYNSGSSSLCASLLGTYVMAGYCAADGGV